MSVAGHSFHKEIETFTKLLPRLLSEEGRYAVVCGDVLLGTYATHAEAQESASQACGRSPCLVKHITQP